MPEPEMRTPLGIPRPSLLEGAARLMDFPGLLVPHLPQGVSEDDWKSLAVDWQVVTGWLWVNVDAPAVATGELVYIQPTSGLPLGSPEDIADEPGSID